ncbi:MAG: hypothetical protein GXZ11_01535 [Tissierellia bacterium]|nr:hypothetical protein [Tissierellia bacterium]
MSKDELMNIINQSLEKVIPTDINRHEETLQFFADEVGRLSLDKAVLFSYIYSVETCKEMLVQILSDLYDQGIISNL